jgi:tetratricopeptide (TPR) repeat protein
MATAAATMSVWEIIMRFTPASIVLACVLALSASSGIGKKGDEKGVASPAAAWMTEGARALGAGDLPAARGAYESALLLDPGNPDIYFALGGIARAEKLPGKAIKYFDMVAKLDPKNQLAIQGQGLAMMDKGAIESARDALGKLKALCKTSCPAAEPLAAAIAAGPPRFATAEAKTTDKANPVEKP